MLRSVGTYHRWLARRTKNRAITTASRPQRTAGAQDIRVLRIDMPNPTTLDQLLYDWLAEPNEQRFERAFNTYFATAFPLLQRHLVRLSRWDPANVEELAQDALLRFFEKVGHGRRQASETVNEALVGIRPLNMGVFHERQVNRWTQDAESFRSTAMTFRISPNSESDGAFFKAAIRALTDRIGPLQDRGDQLLQTIRIDLNWQIDAQSAVPSPDPGANASAATAPAVECLEGGNLPSTVFAQSLASEALIQSQRTVEAEHRRPGVTRFVSATMTVIHHLPALRVPTNGYLFEIALTIYLDECKKRGRQKRGGTGFRESDAAADGEFGAVVHPIERLGVEFDGIGSAGEYLDVERSPVANGTSIGTPAVPSIDPTRQYEDAEFLEKFYAYLRRPLDEAKADYERAQITGRAATEWKKVSSVSVKFERTVAVLSLMGEGYTQEQIAARLDLSRNQVKYVIELVQESYARFAGLSDRPAALVPSAGDQSHV